MEQLGQADMDHTERQASYTNYYILLNHKMDFYAIFKCLVEILYIASGGLIHDI